MRTTATIRTFIKAAAVAATLGGTALGAAAPAGAVAGVPDSGVVWRAALQVQIGNVSNAGTDSDLYAQVNGSRTYLNKAADDFERGSVATYKLRLDNIGRVSDINAVTLGNAGTDGACIERFTLYINDVPMVQSGRLDTPGGTADCKWIDTNDGGPASFTFSKAQHPTAWTPIGATKPAMFMYLSTLQDTMEDEMGNAFYPYTSFMGWGHLYGAPVEAWPALANIGVHNAVNIDFDLENEVGINSEFDLDELARLTCSGQTVTVNMAPAPGSSDHGYGLGTPLARQLKLSLENRLKATGNTCSRIDVSANTITMVK